MANWPAERIDGSVKGRDRQAAIDRFTNGKEGGWSVVFATWKSVRCVSVWVCASVCVGVWVCVLSICNLAVLLLSNTSVHPTSRRSHMLYRFMLLVLYSHF
jgi:hypothetical protein